MPIQVPGPPPDDRPPRERDGRSPLERHAVARLAADVAAMPASDVVQLVLWPDTIAGWAREHDIAPPVAYNMLSRFKPYRRVRELLAHRLDVPGFVLDHLVDAARPLPSVHRAPDAAAGAPRPAEPPVPPRGDAIPPTVRLPAVRDGSNPLEQRALWRVWRDAAALPASVLVQIVLFPETLAEWARRQRIVPSMLYAMLAGTQPHPGLRSALARRLGVSTWAVDLLVDSVRREPAAPGGVPLADPPPARHAPPDTDERPVHERPVHERPAHERPMADRAAADGPGLPPADDGRRGAAPGDQLSLPF